MPVLRSYAAACSVDDMTLQRVETQTVDLNGNNGSDKAFVALNIHHFKVGKLAEKQRFAAMIDSFNENIAFIADILLVSRRKSFRENSVKRVQSAFFSSRGICPSMRAATVPSRGEYANVYALL